VFFPWEKRRGVRSIFGRAPARQALLVVAAVAAIVLLREHERHAAERRATRVSITTTIKAVSAWRADHDLACPASLAELVSGGYLHAVPHDSWGRALRVTCPGRKDALGFDVSSDGPDGEPGGRDRVE
jgi:general secretion pathway protein G